MTNFQPLEKSHVPYTVRVWDVRNDLWVSYEKSLWQCVRCKVDCAGGTCFAKLTCVVFSVLFVCKVSVCLWAVIFWGRCSCMLLWIANWVLFDFIVNSAFCLLAFFTVLHNKSYCPGLIWWIVVDEIVWLHFKREEVIKIDFVLHCCMVLGLVIINLLLVFCCAWICFGSKFAMPSCPLAFFFFLNLVWLVKDLVESDNYTLRKIDDKISMVFCPLPKY